ncbi:hypothetical protein E4U13_007878 [Claviceps humidiphila]|uniref:Uncharacterized protein n=1 Tax=Claviceps humidiphila TaxID=1294629 RepID=A0A9P7PVJ6_9HYPO|nr:hypothetical protein E4U13_007878 [Claviceps humidiphila]
MSTIHDVLSRPSPEPDLGWASRGPNVYSESWVPVSEWRPWVDFTHRNLTSMYAQVLNARWSGEGPQSIAIPFSRFDSLVPDEQSLNHFLSKYLWPSVNEALGQATSIMYLGPGSFGQNMASPDWGLFSMPTPMPQEMLDILLPGLTKLSTKWYPEMRLSEHQSVRSEWASPVSQVSTCAALSDCRYGFLITDEALVVLRFTKKRLDASGTQSGDDNNPTGAVNVELLPPEYAVIPMSASGKENLTVKLAVFCLCLMASGGHHELDYGYPPLR